MSEEEKCREAFERAFSGMHLDKAQSGLYMADSTYFAWQGFLAAWNLRQQAPDGWQLVPKEPTKKMRRAIQEAISDEGGNFAAGVWSAGLAAAPKPEDAK